LELLLEVYNFEVLCTGAWDWEATFQPPERQSYEVSKILALEYHTPEAADVVLLV
jgi:hypothetical protein